MENVSKHMRKSLIDRCGETKGAGSAVHIIVEVIEYVSNSLVIKTILKKSIGNISVTSFDCEEGLMEKVSPFDTFAQIIEGETTLLISGKVNLLKWGQGIMIPAHALNSIQPKGPFKMILTIIKKG